MGKMVGMLPSVSASLEDPEAFVEQQCGCHTLSPAAAGRVKSGEQVLGSQAV